MHCSRALFLGVMQKKRLKGFLKIKAEYNRDFFLTIPYWLVFNSLLTSSTPEKQKSKLETKPIRLTPSRRITANMQRQVSPELRSLSQAMTVDCHFPHCESHSQYWKGTRHTAKKVLPLAACMPKDALESNESKGAFPPACTGSLH